MNNEFISKKELERLGNDFPELWNILKDVPTISLKKTVIYCDIDGVLTFFRKDDSLETVAQKGYSLTLRGQRNSIEMLKLLANDERFEVRILGAVLNSGAAADKALWLEERDLGHIKTIFVPYGENKRDYIEPTGDLNILIDDFTENLINWESYESSATKRFVGVKYRNDINGNHGRWDGLYSVDYRMDAKSMYALIAGLSCELAKK